MKHRATQRRPERRASASPPFRRSRRAGTRLFWGAPFRVARLGATQIKTIFVCGPESEKGAKPTRRPLPPLRVALCSNTRRTRRIDLTFPFVDNCGQLRFVDNPEHPATKESNA